MYEIIWCNGAVSVVSGDVVLYSGTIENCIEYCVSNNIVVKGRCNSCIFWKNHECQNDEYIRNDEGIQNKPNIYSQMFVYCDSHGYYALHQVGPFFGCVHWKERIL